MAVQKITGSLVLALVGAAVATMVLAGVMLTATQTFNNTGVVNAVGVGVFWDYSCTNKTSTIPWGNLAPGQSKTQIVYVNNTGNVGAVLSMTTSAWSPSTAQNYIFLYWNCSGSMLGHGNVVAANFTLSVSPNITGVNEFSFNITITGTSNT